MAECLKEITSISYSITEELVPFALQTIENGNFSLMTRQSVELLRIDFKFTDDAHIRLINASSEAPSTVPTKSISCDAKKIYNTAKHGQKQQLCLDSMLLPDLAQTPLNVALISVKWSPIGSATKYDSYVAYLNNYGGCCIKYRQPHGHQWTLQIADIAIMWQNYSISNQNALAQIDSFDWLQASIHDVHITAIAWNNRILNDNFCSFAGIAASGKLTIFNVNRYVQPMPVVSLFMVIDLGLFKVNILNWYTFEDERNQLHSFLIAGDLEGNIILFQVFYDQCGSLVRDVEQKHELWTENDKLKVTEICAEYHESSRDLCLVISKGSHIVVFLVNIDTLIVVGPEVRFIGNLFISSLIKVAPSSYVLSSVGGSIKRLNITTRSGDFRKAIRLQVTDIKCSINFDNYNLYGMCVSKNHTLWLLAAFPRQPFDHLILRQPIVISICSFSIQDSLLKMIQNPSFKLTDHYDCAEMIRFCSIKNGDNIVDEDYIKLTEKDINIGDELVYKLKVRLIVLSARASYFRRKFRLSETTLFDNQMTMTKNTIMAINYLRQLDHLWRPDNRDNLTAFQKLSAKSMQKYLTDYLNIPCTNEQLSIHCILNETFQSLLNQVGSIAQDSPPELCVYCNEFVEPNQLMCNDNHDMPRCIVTMVQVPIVNQRHCKQCNSVALDDADSIRDILLITNVTEIWCPLCDLLMEMNN